MLDLSLTADSKSTLSAVFPPSSPPTIPPRKSQEVPIVNNGTTVSQNLQKKSNFASQAKINFFEIFFEWRGPGVKKKFQKTLILVL